MGKNKKLQVRDILDAVDAGSEITTLAPVMKKLVEFSSVKGEDIAELSNIALLDPALTTAILRNSNNNSPQKTIPEIAKQIGFQATRSMLLSSEFVSDDSDKNTKEMYRSQRWLWERTLFNASAAEVFAEQITEFNPGVCFTYGLLLDIGSLFLLNHFTDHYLPVIELWRSSDGFLVSHELSSIGVEHTTVGQHLASEWNLGSRFETVIRSHHTPEELDQDDDLIAIMQLSDYATGAFFWAHHKSWVERVYEYGFERFDISQEVMTGLLQRIGSKAEEHITSFKVDATRASSVDLLRSINIELSKATLSYDQIVRELKSAIKKSEELALRLEEANKELRETANIDPLTNVYNRRFFQEFMEWNFTRARRYKSNLGCLMIDIDHFKTVNDTYGHLTGDRVLQEVATRLKVTLRSTDILARFGGEEFIVLLPESTEDTVFQAARRLLQSIAEKRVDVGDRDVEITVSIGYFSYDSSNFDEMSNYEELIDNADKNMYEAKKRGRNMIWPAE